MAQSLDDAIAQVQMTKVPSGDVELLTDLARVALAARKPRRALVWFEKLPAVAAKLPAQHQALTGKASR
jgi:hypothetical protein